MYHNVEQMNQKMVGIKKLLDRIKDHELINGNEYSNEERNHIIDNIIQLAQELKHK